MVFAARPVVLHQSLARRPHGPGSEANPPASFFRNRRRLLARIAEQPAPWPSFARSTFSILSVTPSVGRLSRGGDSLHTRSGFDSAGESASALFFLLNQRRPPPSEGIIVTGQSCPLGQHCVWRTTNSPQNQQFATHRQLSVRLGDRSYGRIQRNTTSPFVKLKMADQEFDKVKVEEMPDMKEKVAAAMADKYWMEVLIRHESHPMVARLVPVATPPGTPSH
jgi:hypothetical protein